VPRSKDSGIAQLPSCLPAVWFQPLRVGGWYAGYASCKADEWVLGRGCLGGGS